MKIMETLANLFERSGTKLMEMEDSNLKGAGLGFYISSIFLKLSQ